VQVYRIAAVTDSGVSDASMWMEKLAALTFHNKWCHTLYQRDVR